MITSDDREPGVLLTLSGWRITAKVVMGLMIWTYEASSSGLNLRYFTPRLRIYQAEMSVTMWVLFVCACVHACMAPVCVYIYICACMCVPVCLSVRTHVCVPLICAHFSFWSPCLSFVSLPPFPILPSSPLLFLSSSLLFLSFPVPLFSLQTSSS